MRRPTTSEYAGFYATYVDCVPDGDLIAILGAAPAALSELLAPFLGERETFAYAPGKWSVRELVGHVIDTERIFGYRALHIVRSDPAALPGMEQDDWAGASNAAGRPLEDLLAEFRAVRSGNTMFFASLDDEHLDRRGVASGLEFSVRALAHIVAGHEIHHRGVLRERYLPAV